MGREIVVPKENSPNAGKTINRRIIVLNLILAYDSSDNPALAYRFERFPSDTPV